jgi:nucleoside-diphosphate-sugar epimerase
VEDEVEGIFRLFFSDVNEPVNVGNPGEFTVAELAELVLELTESSSELRYLPLPEDDPKTRKPDNTRARELLGWQPEISLREGLSRTIKYFRGLQEEKRLGSATILTG